MVKLSVALITYNNDKYIEETLKSLLNQKCSFEFEIVANDDKSTDKTFQILKDYEIRYPEILKVFQNEHQKGILGNFKATLDRCIGDYVFNFDGDDVVQNQNAFEKIIKIFDDNPYIGFVDSGYDKYYEDKGYTDEFVNQESLKVSKENYRDLIYLGKIIPIGTCFKRSLLLQYVDYKTYLKEKISIEDYPILVDMTANSDFERINESFFTYRIHKRSYSYQSGFEKYYFLRKEMLRLFDHFKEKYNFSAELCETFYQSHYKKVMYLAGTYEKKELGRKTFGKIESKSKIDYIHYWASQNKFFRKIVGLRKVKNTALMHIRNAVKINCI